MKITGVALLLIGLLLPFSTVHAQNFDPSKMSPAERRLLLGSLYLSQCVTSWNDFRDVAKTLGKRGIRVISKTDEKSIYSDRAAWTTITLMKDVCNVRIIAAKPEYQKFISTLPALLQVLGGRLKLERKGKAYQGALSSFGSRFTVHAEYKSESVRPYIDATITKKP